MSSNYAYVKKCIDERRAWVYVLKSGPCARCHQCFHPACMDFHHVDPNTKEFDIGSSSFRVGRKRLLAEIAKCVLLCSNCHRLTEYEKDHPDSCTTHP